MNVGEQSSERRRSAMDRSMYGLGTFWLTAVLLLSGCSRSGFDSSVSGSVTLDGKTLGQGGVVFVPNIARARIPPVGTIESRRALLIKDSQHAGIELGQVSSLRERARYAQPAPRSARLNSREATGTREVHEYNYLWH